MRLCLVLRVGNNLALDSLKRSVTKTLAETRPYINSLKEKNKDLMYQKLIRINKWYTRIIGLDQVQLSQDKVTTLQHIASKNYKLEKLQLFDTVIPFKYKYTVATPPATLKDQLLQTQEKRRDVGRQLAEIRQKSLELQDELHKVKRQDDLEKFLDLMKAETEILKLEKSIASTFQIYDQTERELFTAFTNAIRDSHEKQRAQLEYTKYFGVILSIVGSFLAFFYSTMRKQDLKRFIEEKIATISYRIEPSVIQKISQSHETTIEELRKNRETLHEVIKALTTENAGSDLQQLSLLSNEERQEDKVQIGMYRVVGGLCLFYILFKYLSG